MRPIRLTMSAFGSYSGEETIDFTKIKNGCFLITGPEKQRFLMPSRMHFMEGQAAESGMEI